MTKLYDEPIIVHLDAAGRPRKFIWRRHFFQVISCSVIEKKPNWSEWWKPPKPPVYRCITRQGLVADLRKVDDRWLLQRIYD